MRRLFRRGGFILLLIFFLALFLRVYMLGNVPSGFHNDEADLGFVGKFLVLHGRSPSGEALPFSFNKYEDFRPTGFFYLVGISQLILGSTMFAVRFPAALLGALTVFPLFFLARELFKKDSPAYFSSLFLAVLPWHIVLSRAAFEAIAGYFFIVCGLFLLLRHMRRHNWKDLVFALAFFLVSYLFYHGTRTVVPLLLLPFVVFLRNTLSLKIFALFTLLTVIIVILPIGRGRLSQVVFYKNPGTEKRLQELPYADYGSHFSARVFHNKVVVFGRELASHYSQYFSPDFLLWRGGYPERYYVPEVGLAYISIVILLILGVIGLHGAKSVALLPLGWLLVVPIQAVLTYEDIPSVTRASFMVVPIALLSGFGFWWFLKHISHTLLKRTVVLFVLSLLIAELVFFGHEYVVHQRGYKGVLRDEGLLEVSRYMFAKKNNYDKVIAHFGPNLPFYYFWVNNIFDSRITIDISKTTVPFEWENIVFTRDACPSHRADQHIGKKVLYVDDANCEVLSGTTVLFSVVRTDNTNAPRVVERIVE